MKLSLLAGLDGLSASVRVLADGCQAKAEELWLLIDVLRENGRHARPAIGVAGLPRNSPVENQMVCTAV